jgi:hypothetical protein
MEESDSGVSKKEIYRNKLLGKKHTIETKMVPDLQPRARKKTAEERRKTEENRTAHDSIGKMPGGRR